MNSGQRERVERRLAAILAADVAGYSRLMGQDEVGTLARLRACREVVDRLIATHRGRIFNTAGDSVVADFASAVDAVQRAVAVQEAMGRENVGRSEGEAMRFRIGIHVGDIIAGRFGPRRTGVRPLARKWRVPGPISCLYPYFNPPIRARRGPRAVKIHDFGVN
jgi:adenylate cyclase